MDICNGPVSLWVRDYSNKLVGIHFDFGKSRKYPDKIKDFEIIILDILFAMAVQNISLKVLSIICSCWENLLHSAIGNLETLMTCSTSTAA